MVSSWFEPVVLARDALQYVGQPIRLPDMQGIVRAKQGANNLSLQNSKRGHAPRTVTAWPGYMWLASLIWRFAASRACSETPKATAMDVRVSPLCTVYS